MVLCGFMWLSGCMWLKVDKSGDFMWLSSFMWRKVGKVRKSGEKRRKVWKSWKKWWKVVKSGGKW